MAARVNVVTGAGSGIGAALGRLLTSRGERVIGIDLRNAEITADLSAAGMREFAVSRVQALCPDGVDAVIACAGTSAPTPGEQIVSVNYFGAIGLLNGLRGLLAKGRHPRAVAICSIATLMPHDSGLVEACLRGDEPAARSLGSKDQSIAYSSSKVALARWVRRTAKQADWAGAGILLNGVSPGTIKTPMANPILATPEGRAALLKAVPLAVDDYAQPEDIAPLLAFLAGPDNRFVVGQIPFADGGSDVILRGEAVL